MAISTNYLFLTTTQITARERRPVENGDIIKAELIQKLGEGVVLKIGDQQIAAQSSLPLAPGPILLQVIEHGDERVVMRPISPATPEDPALRLILSSGLIASDERIQLVGHAIAEGLPLERNVLLALDGLWREFKYLPSWLPVLMRLAKNKLPLNKLSALAAERCSEETELSLQQAGSYILIDFTSQPPQCSLHHLQPLVDEQQNEAAGDEHTDGRGQPIVIGCSLPHLGPVLAVITSARDSISIELLMYDDARREYVTSELADLRDVLARLVNGLELRVGTLPNQARVQPQMRSIPGRLDIRL
ncbi:MAG: hypothetical protein ACM3ZQ_00455 [Bacillota bacterium]